VQHSLLKSKLVMPSDNCISLIMYPKLIMFCLTQTAILQSWSWAGSIHRLGWVGLGWVKKDTVGNLTQSVSIDDVIQIE